MSWADAIMIDGDQHERHVIGPRHFDVAFWLRQLGNAIREEVTQLVYTDPRSVLKAGFSFAILLLSILRLQKFARGRHQEGHVHSRKAKPGRSRDLS